jgi:hypothetical protein
MVFLDPLGKTMVMQLLDRLSLKDRQLKDGYVQNTGTSTF